MKTDQLTDRIKFINADCMDVMAQYPDKYFDLAIVDPPYGININNNIGRRKGDKKSDYKKAYWDDSAPSAEYFKQLKRVSKDRVVWGANHFISSMPYNSSCWLIWDKKFSNDVSFSSFEMAWTSFTTSCKKFEMFPNGSEERIHPTQKPVKLYEWIYHNYAKPEFKILDTHLGSGSNAIAAHNYGIIEFIGIELDPEYYADSIKRFNRVTAQLRMF